MYVINTCRGVKALGRRFDTPTGMSSKIGVTMGVATIAVARAIAMARVVVLSIRFSSQFCGCRSRNSPALLCFSRNLNLPPEPRLASPMRLCGLRANVWMCTRECPETAPERQIPLNVCQLPGGTTCVMYASVFVLLCLCMLGVYVPLLVGLCICTPRGRLHTCPTLCLPIRC